MALIYCTACADAQSKIAVSDSLWCDHLNEFLKCASLDEIGIPVGKDLPDSGTILPFTPLIHLAPATNEKVAREYNKVTYTCYLFSSPVNNSALAAQFDIWYKKLKGCLMPWGLGRFPNEDKALAAYQDYFFTNSEDETCVRIDVLKENGAYHVRMRIY